MIFVLEMYFFFLTSENAGFLMPTLGLQTSDISQTAKLSVLLMHTKNTSLPIQWEKVACTAIERQDCGLAARWAPDAVTEQY